MGYVLSPAIGVLKKRLREHARQLNYRKPFDLQESNLLLNSRGLGHFVINLCTINYSQNMTPLSNYQNTYLEIKPHTFSLSFSQSVLLCEKCISAFSIVVCYIYSQHLQLSLPCRQIAEFSLLLLAVLLSSSPFAHQGSSFFVAQVIYFLISLASIAQSSLIFIPGKCKSFPIHGFISVVECCVDQEMVSDTVSHNAQLLFSCIFLGTLQCFGDLTSSISQKERIFGR